MLKQIPSNGKRPFIWSNGVMMDLTARAFGGDGWWAQSANAINNRGQIVGGGIHYGNPRAWIMDPLPMPDLTFLGWALSLIGLAGDKHVGEPKLDASALSQAMSVMPPDAESYDLPPAIREAITELASNKTPILADPAAHHEVSQTLLDRLEHQIRSLRQPVEFGPSRS